MNANGNLVAEYSWGLLGPLMRRPSNVNNIRYYIQDGLGHTRALLDNAGNVTDWYVYDAWGGLNNSLSSTPTANPFRWNGAYGYVYIPVTGLYHVGAREYDPRVGRWLQRDPIEVESGDPNLYRYGGNDPINCADPTGQVTAAEAFDIGIGFIPFAGSLWDMYQGWRNDDPTRFGFGAASLLLDIATFGGGSLGKGAARGGFRLATATAGAADPRVLGFAAREGLQFGKPRWRSSDNVYRAGGSNPGNLTVRPCEEGLSFRDSLSNPWPLPEGQRPVFRPGDEYVEVDPHKLPPGSVIHDNKPVGHVTVRPLPIEMLKGAIIGKGRFPK